MAYVFTPAYTVLGSAALPSGSLIDLLLVSFERLKPYLHLSKPSLSPSLRRYETRRLCARFIRRSSLAPECPLTHLGRRFSPERYRRPPRQQIFIPIPLLFAHGRSRSFEFDQASDHMSRRTLFSPFSSLNQTAVFFFLDPFTPVRLIVLTWF